MERVLINGINYELDPSYQTATVCSLGNGIKYQGNIVIPSSVSHNGISYSVTSIGDWAFYGCTGLTAITMPYSVTSIGSWAFRDCTGLTSIEIPNSVTSIGSWAFSDCTGLTSIEIPNSVTSIGISAFYGCAGLTSIAIPNSVTSIGDWAFSDCTGLTSIEIPNSVTSIGGYSFFGGAFSGCTGLTSIEIPNSVTSIESEAFMDCTGLTSIEIPDSVTSIEGGAFAGCKGLTSIEIPNSVTSIGRFAFSGCTGLTDITIPDSVTSIESGAFENTYWYNNLPDGLVYINNVLYAYKGKMPSNTTIVIRKGTISISSGAFAGCKGLTSIEIPNSVTSIGWRAFADCTGLTSIEIPDSVTSIWSFAFEGCKGLTSIEIPNSVTSIGDYAFSGCTGLTAITIPDSVTSIGSGAFEDCEKLQVIRVPKGKKTIFCEDDLRALQDKIIEYKESLIGDIQYELDDNFTAVVCAKNEKYAGNVVIPSRVEQQGNIYTIDRIAQGAFRDCYDLTSITLPKSINKIGQDVFSGCENLQVIRVPQGMTDAFCKMGLEPWRDNIVEPCQEEYTILLNIARGYELGIGMARNLAQAVLCYVQAADKGCAEAAYHLGELYESGHGLPQDYRQAADWFAKSAQLYHPNGEARRQACLRMIEEENVRLSALQEEQRLARQTQLVQRAAAQKPQKTILFFDTETNGLPGNYKLGYTATSNWPRLIQLGWIITDELGNVLKRKSQLIYPQSFTIDAEVTRLTGITTAEAQRNGVCLQDILPEFMADVESVSLLVGHNVDFDMHIIGCELYRQGMDYRPLVSKPTVCTMVRSTDFCALPSKSKFYSGYKYPTLTELYTKLFGHTFSGAHDALSDITATKDCYFELLRRGII